ncbi:MAG TPA: hypothetical protein VMF90_14740 [Rhizobiaceae bacterium]|nr:hypothetical protein [Rhizobiaceae bacterium]
MIIDMSKECAEIEQLVKSGKTGLDLAFALAKILDRGMAQERERCIRIVQRNRNVINPMLVVAEIRRPVR